MTFSDISTGGQGTWSFFYEDVDEAQLPLLKRAVRKRLRRAYPEAKFRVAAALEELEAEAESPKSIDNK